MQKAANRLIYFLIPGFFLVLTVLTLNYGQILLRWTGVGAEVRAGLERVGAEALTDQWEAADRSVQEVRHLWAGTRRRMMISYGMEEIEMLDEVLAELQGAVEARDAGQVQIVNRRSRAMWEDIDP